MNATWNEHACKWKEYERTWMHVGIKMKGVHEMKKNGNEHKWKEHERIMKGNYCNMKENAYKWMQHERNMKCCRSTWNQQNKSSIHFRASLGMDFGFMLDLEYADSHKTLESDSAPPKAITIAVATTQMQRILTGAHMIIYSMIISIFLAKHGIWGGPRLGSLARVGHVHSADDLGFGMITHTAKFHKAMARDATITGLV